MCPGGVCPGGVCPGGVCPGGVCPGGVCPGGCPVADPGGPRGHGPLGPVKIGHKKMATEGGRIDFMFLGPPPLPGQWIRYWCLPREAVYPRMH